MRGHAHRQGRERPESGEVGRLEFRARGVDHRELKVTVRRRPPVTREVLEHGQYAAGHQTRGDRPADGRDLLRRVAVSTVADYRIAGGNWNVGNRQTIHIDAERKQIAGDQATAKPSRLQSSRMIAIVDFAVSGAGGIARPVWRGETLHAT